MVAVGWVNALVMLVVGVVLVSVAGLFPYPLSTVAYVIGLILAIVGLILLVVSLIRGAA